MQGFNNFSQQNQGGSGFFNNQGPGMQNFNGQMMPGQQGNGFQPQGQFQGQQQFGQQGMMPILQPSQSQFPGVMGQQPPQFSQSVFYQNPQPPQQMNQGNGTQGAQGQSDFNQAKFVPDDDTNITITLGTNTNNHNSSNTNNTGGQQAPISGFCGNQGSTIGFGGQPPMNGFGGAPQFRPSSPPQTTGFGGPAQQGTGFGMPPPQPSNTGFGGPAPSSTGFGMLPPQPSNTGFGMLPPQNTGFGGASSPPQTTGFGGPAPSNTGFGIPPQNTGFGMLPPQPSNTGFGVPPSSGTGFGDAGATKLSKFEPKLVMNAKSAHRRKMTNDNDADGNVGFGDCDSGSTKLSGVTLKQNADGRWKSINNANLMDPQQQTSTPTLTGNQAPPPTSSFTSSSSSTTPTISSSSSGTTPPSNTGGQKINIALPDIKQIIAPKNPHGGGFNMHPGVGSTAAAAAATTGSKSTNIKRCEISVFTCTDTSLAHRSNFSHVCEKGIDCTDTSLDHKTHYIHIKNPLCDLGANCPQLTDPFHRSRFHHTGMPDFLKPCKSGFFCPLKSDPEHMKMFQHTNPPFFPDAY